MIPGSLKKFFKQLSEWTDSGEVTWKEGAVSDTYYCTHKTYNLHFHYNFDEERELASYTMRIKNGAKTAIVIVDDSEEDFAFMRNLYSAITVSAADMSGIADDFFS